MTDRAECLRRAEQAERDAAELSPGVSRNELQRVAAAFRQIAALLDEARERTPKAG